MFSVSVFYGETGQQQCALMYRAVQEAERVFTTLTEGVGDTVLTDDYGFRILVRRDAIKAVIFEDMERAKMFYIERALHQARVNAKLQSMAQADPALKAAGLLNSHPHMMPPMGRQ